MWGVDALTKTLKTFDHEANAPPVSGKHSTKSYRKDLEIVVEQLLEVSISITQFFFETEEKDI